jgi:hypothetical protein
MKLQKALEIVLELAQDNCLDDNYCETKKLKETQKKQFEALEKVNNLLQLVK